MVAGAQIPYAFYNITSAYNNNSFSFSFPTGSSTYATYTITIPDGFYTTTSLNYFLQQYFITNGFYLVNSSGQNVYYLSVQYNTFQYGNQILAYTVPTSLPAGYTLPTGYTTGTIFGGNGFPTVSRTPTFNFSGTNNFNVFLGFSQSAVLPAQGTTTNYSINSTQTPVGSTVNSLILRCSLVDNKVGNPQDILDSFPIGSTTFGTNINYSPAIPKWIKMNNGTFSNFYITLCDQNLNLINSLDSNILITLLLRFNTPKLLKKGE
jgi:hypothetical protein